MPRAERVPPAAAPPLPGFERMARVWDQQLGCFVARILPGELYVGRGDEVITTILGSCVAACINDPVAGIGGMNHFMLPSSADATPGPQAARYGSHAMQQLVDGVVKNGGQRRNLEVKLFGGGRMIEAMSDVGARNIEFVRRYVAEQGLKVVAEDLGSVYPRRVNYYPATGRALVKRLRPLHKRVIAQREQAHLDLRGAPPRKDAESV